MQLLSSPNHRNIELVVAALTAGSADPVPDRADAGATRRCHHRGGRGGGTERRGRADRQLAIFDADGEPLLVLTSGANRVDTGKVGALIEADRVRRTSHEFVRAATGQAIGRVAPGGHSTALRTLVDRTLDFFDEVWAAGGIPRAIFPTTFTELVKVTSGHPADVAQTTP